MKNTINTLCFKNFFQAYIECALWSSTDYEIDTPLDQVEADLSDDARAELIGDAIDFYEAHSAYWSKHGWGDDQAGHDFWLTRNGHGAGFWDRGMGEAGKVLADAARIYGSVDLYVSDEGTIEVE